LLLLVLLHVVLLISVTFDTIVKRSACTAANLPPDISSDVAVAGVAEALAAFAAAACTDSFFPSMSDLLQN